MNATLRRFRDLCLSLPETSEVMVETWGHPTFRVGGHKMFASCSSYDSDRPSFGLKVEKAHQQALVNSDTRYTIAAYVGKHGWITIDGRGDIDWAELRELVEESYVLNAPIFPRPPQRERARERAPPITRASPHAENHPPPTAASPSW